MDSFEYHSDIHDCLDGAMSADRLKEFKVALSRDIKLREEFEFIRSMRLALDVEQSIGELISADDIVDFASDSSDMDDDMKLRISQSAANAPELEYLIKTSRAAVTSASESNTLHHIMDTHKPVGLLTRFLQYLFPPTLMFRSAMAYVAVLTLAIVGFGPKWENESTTQLATLVNNQGLRGGSEEQRITLEESAEILKLSFALPIDTSYKYIYELLADDSSVIMTWHDWRPRTFDTLVVSTRVLTTGQYMLRVRESNQEGKLENLYILPFTVIR